MSLSLSSMAPSEKDGDVVGLDFEQGMSWLPSQVLDEALEIKTWSEIEKQQHHQYNHRRHHYPDQSNSKYSNPRSWASPHYVINRHEGAKNWVSGGHGMQAIFLDSSEKSSSGTGFFLPQRAGTNFHSKKKPTCAPVLLPERVIQALNLNVHALGLQISPKDRHRKRYRSGQENDLEDCMSPRNKMNGSKVDDQSPSSTTTTTAAAQCYIMSENQTDSFPELCLPNEWTY